MNSRKQAGKAWLTLATALLITAGASQSWAAALNTKGEAKCHQAMSKAIGKHTVAVVKAMATCENAVLAAGMGTCPDAAASTAIAKSAGKIAKAVNKKCQSECSVTGVSCIDNSTCPPNGTLLENCTGDPPGSNVFRLAPMGFPGPYCESVIDTNMTEPDHFGACAAGVGELVADQLIENVFGDLASPPNEAGQDCLDAINKALPKSISKVVGKVTKCRNTQLTADSAAILPDNCPTADPKVADSISKTVSSFVGKISGSCTDAAVSQLSLCGEAVGGIVLAADATDCLSDVIEQAGYSTADAETRDLAGVSVINGAFPSTAAARCGDNVINQQASQFLLNGEECDGDDLGDCASCLPPGDIFQCTCAETRRSRAFADGFGADLDNGWSGSSHNAKVTNGAGFVADTANCDCSAFTDATCTGTSSDPVCDVSAELNPRCSHRIGDGTTCDQVGNTDGAHFNSDCQVCDRFAGNEDDYCTGAARYCLGGANTGDRCNQTSDCPGGGCTGSGVCESGPFAGNGCSGPQHCGVCLGGVNVGLACSVPANCPGSTCQAHTCQPLSCLGGANDGNPCGDDDDCPSGRCAETSDCASQCYAEDDLDGDTPLGGCARQADCGDGERCRGVCDKSNFCLKIRNGAPLPLSAEGTSVCIDSQFFSNMTGTRNIVTGEHAINYELRSVTILANEINSSPCPVCGGFCATTRIRCSGTCTGPELECRYGVNIGQACLTDLDCDDNLCGPVACRFDDDCPSGTCDGTGSPDCAGSDCRLDLACSIGPNQGQPCRIEAATAFGTTSADCPPDPSTNVSGAGLAISWTPLTSGTIEAENPAPCDAAGYQNYDCNCVTGAGSTRNQPNRCQPACTDPDPEYFGRKCSGFTTCVGGAENGVACDEDSDCSGGGTCTGNPRVCGDGNTGECSVRQCVGGPNAGQACLTPAQCAGGTCPTQNCIVGGPDCTFGVCQPDNCVTDLDCEGGLQTCEDACPAGLCTPLCVERGICSGGSKDGLKCALDVDCLGGGTCVPEDPEEGACAQGAFTHCDGPGWEFVSCQAVDVGTKKGCGFGADGVEDNPDDNIGAGFCVADITNCFINDGAAEGGSTLNGNGDPTNSYSVASYCIPASSNSAVNATAGLPGPGRIRQSAVVVPNYTVLP